MGKIKYHTKWPCGLEHSVEASGYSAEGESPKNLVCPLHGKKCKRGK